ncbi:MAG: hypothetical protein WD226_02790 [Planctomycetota bacterium]
MPAPPDDARLLRAEVLDVRPSGADGVVLAVRPERELAPVRPSRFFMLQRLDRELPWIPRPFSIYRQAPGRVEFLLKVMGRGTRALAESLPGTPLRMTGPLGNGWPTLDGDGPPWVFLAGGVGVAPFPMAIDAALAGMDGAKPVLPGDLTFLFGAATADLLYDVADYEASGVRLFTATDDGSHGFHGNVLALLDQLVALGEVAPVQRLLACGPDPMLRAVERRARELGLDAWLSLETPMGCGVGICNGCPVDTLPDGPLGAWPNAKCCVEGPVFSTDAVTLLAGAHCHA